MNEKGWTRDKTPYLVFCCKKCHQYSYVKISQKTKKCLRCGSMHQVSSIMPNGDIVKGMTNALELVKKKQGEFKRNPQFEVDNSFKIHTESNGNLLKKQKASNQKIEQKKKISSNEKEGDFSIQFKEMLLELACIYKSFPKYLIDIMAENYSIPQQKVSGLLRIAIRKGFLNYSKKLNHYFLSNSRRTS